MLWFGSRFLVRTELLQPFSSSDVQDPALQAALQRQSQALVDPDSIFAEVSTCDLETIFKEKAQKGFRKRTSSANWSSDKVTVIEKRNYRKDMGFNSAANQ